MNKNPPVPRFPHPEPKQPEPQQKIIKKKPRVPVVPDHLRKSRSPSPYSELRKQNEDIIIHINKKPRVPKVAELLPDVKLVKPKKQSTNFDQQNEPKSPTRKPENSSKADKKESRLQFKQKRKSLKQKNKGKVVIYNAAGVPVAVYNNVELKRPEYHPNRDLIPISGSDDGQFHVTRGTNK